MDEDVLAALLGDEAESLRIVEPLHSSLCHARNLSSGSSAPWCSPAGLAGLPSSVGGQTKTPRELDLARRVSRSTASPNRGNEPGLSQNRGKVYTKPEAWSSRFITWGAEPRAPQTPRVRSSKYSGRCSGSPERVSFCCRQTSTAKGSRTGKPFRQVVLSRCSAVLLCAAREDRSADAAGVPMFFTCSPGCSRMTSPSISER